MTKRPRGFRPKPETSSPRHRKTDFLTETSADKSVAAARESPIHPFLPGKIKPLDKSALIEKKVV